MDFIAQNTTIPIPKVLDVFNAQGKVHIVLEYVKAPTLEIVWHKLSPSDKLSVVRQIQGFVKQLRQLPPSNPGVVEAIGVAALWDFRLCFNDCYGPFDSIEEFHKFIGLHYVRDHYPKLKDDFSRCEGRIYKTKFTHGDISPRNILVRVRKSLQYWIGSALDGCQSIGNTPAAT